MIPLLAGAIDLASDTWAATDGLGRVLPMADAVGAPRTNRTVALFYFLWHAVHDTTGRVYDISKIQAADPDFLTKTNCPLVGPYWSCHHWGEPLFGYYRSTDRFVYRKHAQMLADAGVDVIVFDVTNGPTYDDSWRTLLDAFAEVRAAGGRSPQIAFLCPFGLHLADKRAQVLSHLWNTLYKPGIHPELWFHWNGKPLILCHPDHAFTGSVVRDPEPHRPVELLPGHTLGQTFRSDAPFSAVSVCTPTYGPRAHVAVTLSVRVDGPTGPVRAQKRFSDVFDNQTLTFTTDAPLPPGTYHLELSNPSGRIGWWTSAPDTLPHDGAFADGRPVSGLRHHTTFGTGPDTQAMLAFFTFRRPWPAYNNTFGRNGYWSWLETHPQHVYSSPDGAPEMMSVGVAQNTKPGHVLTPMSDPDAMGRAWHNGANDPAPDAVARGLNFQEQWDHALKADPPLLFVTGWNEWWASRFKEWMGWSQPGGVFPDQFDAAHSRDCEPVRGHWGDAFFYQLAANIRRYKGARPAPTVTSASITIDGAFTDWASVAPEFRDTPGDPVNRDEPGWEKGVRYIDHSGRNDIVAAKVSADAANVYFYVRTAAPLKPGSADNWMLLHIARSDASDYAFTVQPGAPKSNERVAVGTNEIELSVPRARFGAAPLRFDFKWADNCRQTGDWTDFTLHGDAAPNDRWNYRAVFP